MAAWILRWQWVLGHKHLFFSLLSYVCCQNRPRMSARELFLLHTIQLEGGCAWQRQQRATMSKRYVCCLGFCGCDPERCQQQGSQHGSVACSQTWLPALSNRCNCRCT